MEPLEEYMAKVGEWQRNLGLQDTILPLFNALFQRKLGGNPNNLTRMIKDLPQYRKLILDTFSELAEIRSKAREVETTFQCRQMMQDCKEILEAQGEALVNVNHVPFMKLPPELRRRVYKYYIANLFTNDEKRRVHNLKVTCDCPTYLKLSKKARSLDFGLCCTSRCIRDELLPMWFASQQFYFHCSCQLRGHLLNNMMQRNIRAVSVQWCGTWSEQAFKLLLAATRLRAVLVVVTDGTAKVPSAREQELAEYFKARPYRRLTDACGFDELVKLAQHLGMCKISIHGTAYGVPALQSYLESKCKASEQSAKPTKEMLLAKALVVKK